MDRDVSSGRALAPRPPVRVPTWLPGRPPEHTRRLGRAGGSRVHSRFEGTMRRQSDAVTGVLAVSSWTEMFPAVARE